MKIRLIGMGEAEAHGYGIVSKGDILEVSDQDGANFLRQVGMWESAEKKEDTTETKIQNKKMEIQDTK